MRKKQLSTYGDMKKALESKQGFIVTNGPGQSVKYRRRIHRISCNILKKAFEELGVTSPDVKLGENSKQPSYLFNSIEAIDVDYAEPCRVCKPTHQT